MEYTPDSRINGDWYIDVNEALGDDMTDEFWNQTNPPAARPAQTEKYVSEDIFAWWTTDPERSEPFSGTIKKGDTYIAYLQIETADGRDFDPDVRVTVNGNPPLSVCRDEDQPFMVTVIACAEAK